MIKIQPVNVPNFKIYFYKIVKVNEVLKGCRSHYRCLYHILRYANKIFSFSGRF